VRFGQVQEQPRMVPASGLSRSAESLDLRTAVVSWCRQHQAPFTFACKLVGGATSIFQVVVCALVVRRGWQTEVGDIIGRSRCLHRMQCFVLGGHEPVCRTKFALPMHYGMGTVILR